MHESIISTATLTQRMAASMLALLLALGWLLSSPGQARAWSDGPSTVTVSTSGKDGDPGNSIGIAHTDWTVVNGGKGTAYCVNPGMTALSG